MVMVEAPPAGAAGSEAVQGGAYHADVADAAVLVEALVFGGEIAWRSCCGTSVILTSARRSSPTLRQVVLGAEVICRHLRVVRGERLQEGSVG